jgi:outer membrane protein assembly factor BamB
MMGDFLCTDRKTHKPVWQKNFVTEFNADKTRWGIAQAPYLYKNLVIVAVQAPDAFAIAFDRVTGAIVWKSPGLGMPGYVSPLVATLGGVEQLVVLSASTSKDKLENGVVAGLSLKDGTVLWKYDGFQCYIPIPYPVVIPGDRLFVTGGYKAGSVMIQIKKTAKGLESAELFKLPATECGSQIQQPILYKDHLYLVSNSNEYKSGMTCLSLDGKIKWRTSATPELPGFDLGALMLADDMIIALDGKTGMLHLIEPTPEKYKELARAKVVDGKELWAPLALTDGKLLVRSQDVMKCLDLKRP